MSLALYDSMDYNLPSSSVHGIFQARILEWISIPFSREASQPRNWIQVSHISGRFFIAWATREDLNKTQCSQINKFIFKKLENF